MGRSSSEHILLIHPEPTVHEELRAILHADQPAGSAAEREQVAGLEESASRLTALLKGIEVDSARDGAEGQARLREGLQMGRPYVLVVVGVHLGSESDGVETVRRIWSDDGEMPVLLIESENYTAAERHEAIVRLGHGDRFLFLSRPMDPHTVRQTVAVQADRRLARDELRNVTNDLGRALQRAQEQAETAERAKTEFMANISHEIRTPMNAILGFTRLLIKEPLSADQLEKLHYVRDAGQSLLSVVDNVLDFSKLAAGQLGLATTAFNLDAVLCDVLEATREAADDKQLTVQHHVVGAVPRWFRGDKNRLRQILVNLVNNAVKFTDDGAIQLQTTLDEETEQTATLRIVVTDTGVGIPVERQAIIFESFSQADGSSTRQFEGVGLGLSICKQLVDLMGGQIGFRSDPGQGTAFWLTVTLQKYVAKGADVPIDDQVTATPPAPSRVNRPTAKRPGKPLVLVAEDDHLNRTLAEMLLTRAGCMIDLAENGEEALAMAEATDYDLVLMDVEMPKLDGIEAIERIRRSEANADRTVPIVVLTAHDTPDNRRRSVDAGADGYLTKPFEADALLTMLQSHIPGSLEAFQQQTPPEDDQTEAAEDSNAIEDQLRILQDARQEENLAKVEHSAAMVRSLARQADAEQLADHAMRVQLAARSGDLDQVDAAIGRLQESFADHPAEAPQPNTSLGASHH